MQVDFTDDQIDRLIDLVRMEIINGNDPVENQEILDELYSVIQ